MVDGKFNNITGWAAKQNGTPLEPWTYEARPIGTKDVEIQIQCCGICGSDIHTIDSGWGKTNHPVIVGHEIIGKVTAKGDEVSHLQIGDLVGVGAQAFGCLESDCRACSRGLEPHCPKGVFTYNAKYPDGKVSQGGYAEAVRVNSHFAIRIPSEISPQEAAPLMCAGPTVFTPMLRKGVKKGDRVGVVGIGGLGHLALQFARALGCEVTAFSSSDNKKEECLKLGATKFINIKKEEDLKKAKMSLDYLYITSNAKSNDYNKMASWVDYEGQMCLLALPENNLDINPRTLIKGSKYIGGSLIGGIKDIEKTLSFAAEHNIRPIIEKMPMSKVNEGIQSVRDGKVRYRVVLEN
ncbi:hypothetical protein H4219_003068 [Mycoemilia scoparia]|uniref:Enoyl reductase (ER) domain-containing protein n=1 Tax=Mycoemilia scoparia TaxID=417184 RepID=A0A9W7ZVY4_9FUNG|nr:hypothetical protein H4219_003068 [Mycoemilia scoparia]